MLKRVGILRGGMGKNYHDSLRRGGEIILHVSENLSEKYQPVDIFIDKEGVWHIAGRPIKPADLMHRVEMVWNLSHPNHARPLKSLAVPFINSLHLEHSRDLLRDHLKNTSIALPKSLVLPVYWADIDGPIEHYAVRKGKEVHAKFGAPWLLRSYADDKDMGVHVCKTFPELVNAILDGARLGQSILVEEFVSGRPATLYSVPDFRKQDPYVFPIADRSFSLSEKGRLYELTKSLREALGAEHFLRSDLVVTPQGRVYLMSFESTPDLKPGSHFEAVCEHVGAKTHHVIEHLLERAMQ